MFAVWRNWVVGHSGRIDPVGGTIADVLIAIGLHRRSDWIFGQKSTGLRIVVSSAVVIQAGLLVGLASAVEGANWIAVVHEVDSNAAPYEPKGPAQRRCPETKCPPPAGGSAEAKGLFVSGRPDAIMGNENLPDVATQECQAVA